MKKVLAFALLMCLAVLTACHEEIKFKVTFNSLGGSPTPEVQEVVENGLVTTVTAPTKEGFTFLGWYDSQTGGTKWDFATNKVTKEITLYARWEAVIVADTTSPEIKLNAGIDTIRIGETWVDAGVTVTDDSGETIVALVSGAVDSTVAGVYEITYTATDSSGNTASRVRIVTVY